MSRCETIGPCTLFLADCLEALPLVGKCDAMVTDPPFSIPHTFAPQKGRKGTRALSFAWDKTINALEIVEACKLGAERVASAFIFCGLRQATPLAEMLSEAGMTDKMACWVKKCPAPPAPGNWWPSGFELAVYGYKPGAHFESNNASRSNVFVADSYRHGQPGKVDHPTQKPLGMMLDIVEPMVPDGGTCLDPFMGSGTTGVACVKTGRRFIGIEINPKFFEIACKRIDAATREPRLPLPEPKLTQQRMAI